MPKQQQKKPSGLNSGFDLREIERSMVAAFKKIYEGSHDPNLRLYGPRLATFEELTVFEKTLLGLGNE